MLLDVVPTTHLHRQHHHCQHTTTNTTTTFTTQLKMKKGPKRKPSKLRTTRTSVLPAPLELALVLAGLGLGLGSDLTRFPPFFTNPASVPCVGAVALDRYFASNSATLGWGRQVPATPQYGNTFDFSETLRSWPPCFLVLSSLMGVLC